MIWSEGVAGKKTPGDCNTGVRYEGNVQLASRQMVEHLHRSCGTAHRLWSGSKLCDCFLGRLGLQLSPFAQCDLHCEVGLLSADDCIRKKAFKDAYT